MSTDSEIGEVVARVKQRALAVCENCGGEGYTDMSRSACAVCLGAGVTTPEMLAALGEAARLRAAIQAYLDGDYDHPRSHRPGQCRHGVFYYVACESCVDEHFTAALNPTPNETPDPQNGGAT